jgi:phosphatidylglycerol:prolipoprotein diacylglycerol transferase
MIRELFHIGPLSISPFGVTLVLAFVAAYLQLRWGLERLGIGSDDDANALVFAAGLGGIVGGKVYYALLYQDWHLLFSRSGLVWYGGFLVGAAAVLFTMRSRRLAPWRTADAAAPALALGYGVGRIGCLLVGDDYGVPTDLPWGMTFPEGPIPTRAGVLRTEFGVDLPADVPADQLVAVHPTQAYETLLACGIWLLGLYLLRRGVRPAGVPAMVVLGLLAVERFGIEILRAKDDRFFGPLTLAQVFSLLVLAVAVALLVRRRRAAAD